MAAVTRQAVSAVESGHSDPSLRVALALGHALGMTVEELFGPGDPADPVLAQPVAPARRAGPRGPVRPGGRPGPGAGAPRRPGRGPPHRPAPAHARGRGLRSGPAAARDAA